MNCEKHGPQKSAVCWKCKEEAKLKLAYDTGYQNGLAASKLPQPSTLTMKEWRQLASFCHPDKHQNSQASNDVQSIVLKLKPEENGT